MGNAATSGVATTRLSEVPSGSILLVRQETATSIGQLDPSIVRGIASAQRGGIYSVQQQSLATWTHCALVLERKGKHYVVQASPSGIVLIPAARHVLRLQSAGARVAVRRLTGPMTEDMRLLLTSLLHAAAAGCEWEAYMPEVAHLDGAPASPAAGAGAPAVLVPGQFMRLPRAPVTEEEAAPAAAASAGGGDRQRSGEVVAGGGRDSESRASSLPSSARHSHTHTQRSGGGSSARSTDLSPFARELIRMLIPRVYGALQALPPRLAVELRRAFGVVDTNSDGRVHVDDVGRVLTELRGAPVSSSEARLFAASMDVQSPDAVSLDHFLTAFARQPLRDIPVEHDVDAIMCGEFVACIYEMLGLLPPRRAEVTAFHPPASSAASPAASRSRSGSLSGGEAFAGGGAGSATGLGLPRVTPDTAPGRRSSLASSVDSRGRPPRPPASAAHEFAPSPDAALRGSGASLPHPSSVGGGWLQSRGGGGGGGGTLVVVDASAADFRHFTPTSFSTLHRPRLQLLRGRLEPEELLSAAEEAEAAGQRDARHVAAAATAAAAAQGGPDPGSVRAAALILTAGTALADPSVRPATATTRAASRAAAAAAASEREWEGDRSAPSACAPHLDERGAAGTAPAPPSRWLPPLLIADPGRGGAAQTPAPLPTVSVLQRGGSLQLPGWGDGRGSAAASVAIDVGAHRGAGGGASAGAGASGAWR